MNDTIKGYKAFNKGLICRGKQYAENTRFIEDVEPKLCSKGIHFCELPLDVLKYYSPFSEFAEVEALGKTDRGDDKTATDDIQIKGKITIFQLFQAHFEKIFADVAKCENLNQTSGNEAHSQTSGGKAHSQTSGGKAHSQTSGNYAHSQTSGNYAHSQTSGYEAHSQTSGDYAHSQTSGNEAHSQTSGDKAHSQTSGYEAHSQTSGDYAHSQTSGDYAHSQTSGNEAHSQTSGDYAHSQTSGNYAHSQTSGNEAIACSLGIQAKAKAEKGWIVITDWRYDGDKYVIHKIHSAKVGHKIKGVKIEPDKFYWFSNGNLQSEVK